MNVVDRSEVLSLGEYERIRPHFRKRIIQEKRLRRVPVGEHLTGVFENHDTVLLQIQEMLRTERITAEPGIAHEIATYNELVPGAEQLSLTLFVEIPDAKLREEKLVEYVGLERHIALEVDGRRVSATGEREHTTETDRTTAVHYLKFDLGADGAAAVREGKTVALVADHPAYQARAELSAETLAQLAVDLGPG